MDLLKRLSEASGPSGSETEIRKILRKELKPYVDELYVDKFGNLVGRKKGKGASVLLSAHMDEVGMMVRNIDPGGKIFISAIGGLEPITLLGESVRIVPRNGKEVNGIVTTMDIQDSVELTQLPNMADVYVDTGLTKDDVSKAGISPGDYIHIMKEFVELGNSKYISGKALDDRIGCYMLLELAKKLKKSKPEIHYIFTVQEEIGMYGSKTSIYSIDPDYAIVLDVTESDDAKDKHGTKILGHGPVLVIKDAEMITTKCINEWLVDIASKNKIPLQKDVSDFGTTDALRLAVSKGGLPCTVLGVPVRNIHTATSIAHMDDITGGIKILAELMKNPPKICF